MRPFMKHWKELDIRFDAVYSGFLGSFEQLDIVKEFFSLFKREDNLILVDPVMGDNGELYKIFTPKFAKGMRSLCERADIIVPNLTEAAIILGEPIGDEWAGTDISDEEAHRLVDALVAKGAKHVVLKGIQREGETCIRNFVGGVDMDTVEVHNEYLPYMLHGTGDLYASCLMAAVMAGRTLEEAVRFAGDFVHDAMIVSAKQPEFRDRGVSFEPLLGKVCELL